MPPETEGSVRMGPFVRLVLAIKELLQRAGKVQPPGDASRFGKSATRYTFIHFSSFPPGR
jgi:hypothetical protein